MACNVAAVDWCMHRSSAHLHTSNVSEYIMDSDERKKTGHRRECERDRHPSESTERSETCLTRQKASDRARSLLSIGRGSENMRGIVALLNVLNEGKQGEELRIEFSHVNCVKAGSSNTVSV